MARSRLAAAGRRPPSPAQHSGARRERIVTRGAAFHGFARNIAVASGRPVAFLTAVAVVLTWAATGGAADMNMVRPVNRAERISLMVLLLASLVLVVLVVRPFAGALFMAAVLAVAFHSTCRRLTAILRGNRACAAFLLTLGLVF